MNNIDRFLGESDVESYCKEEAGGLEQEELETIYNNFVNGNISDFKNAIGSVSELAQFLMYAFESGMDVREIQRMLKILA